MDFFLFLPFRLPAIARRTGEAGGDETEKGPQWNNQGDSTGQTISLRRERGA